MPTLTLLRAIDTPPSRQKSIVLILGTTVKGDFADGVILGEMTNELLKLQRE